MRWRPACVSLFATVAMALCAGPPALAGTTATPAGTWTPLWQTTLGAPVAAALVNSRQDAWRIFTETDGPGWAIAAQRVFADGSTASPVVLVAGLSAVDAITAQRDLQNGFIIVWKTAHAIWAQRFDALGSARFAPRRLLSDSEAAAAHGAAAATATVTAVAADSGGGFYVAASVKAGGSSFGLLAHVNAAGVLQLSPPGKVLPAAVVALTIDGAGHAFALLQGSAVALQRFSPTLAPDWRPVTLSASGGSALSLSGTSPATVLWSQRGHYWLQRVSAIGKRVLLLPTIMNGGGHTIATTPDEVGGTWVIDAVARGLRLRHVDSIGRIVAGGTAGTTTSLGLSVPALGVPRVNRAGDVFVPYSGTLTGVRRAGVAKITAGGSLVRVTLDGGASAPPLVTLDGAGGAFASWRAAGDGLIARLGFAGRSLTCEPAPAVLRYGSTVTVSGYALSGLFAATNTHVALRSRVGGGPWTTVKSVTTDAEGFYAVRLTPRFSSNWSAFAAISGHDVASPVSRVGVQVRVTIALAHAAGGVLISGTVAPAHAGAIVSLQRLDGKRWTTIAHLRLDRRSAYRYVWPLPRRSGTTQLRVAVPDRADNLGNVSAAAIVIVRVGAGAVTARLAAP